MSEEEERMGEKEGKRSEERKGGREGREREEEEWQEKGERGRREKPGVSSIFLWNTDYR